MKRRGSTAVVGCAMLMACLLSGDASADNDPPSMADRLLSVDGDSFRLLDAEVLTLLRYEQRQVADFLGVKGQGSSEFRLLSTPIFAALEVDSSHEPGGGERRDIGFLMVLGARLFSIEQGTDSDPLAGGQVRRGHWGLLELPMIGPLIGADFRGDEINWILLFLGGD